MAIDGIFLYAINLELQSLIDSVINNIFQISKFEFVFEFRNSKFKSKLLVSASPSGARINLTNRNFKDYENSSSFLEVLCCCLVGAKFVKTRQLGLDRLLFLEFEKEAGAANFKKFVLAVELFGKSSNIILFNGVNSKIVDVFKKFSDTSLSGRIVEPGRSYYSVGFKKHKLNILNCSLEQLLDRIFSLGALKLSKALGEVVEGVSPVVARELAFSFDQKMLFNFSDFEKKEVFYVLEKFKSFIELKKFKFCLFLDGNVPKEFCYFELEQFGNLLKIQQFASASELVDFFYYKKFLVERINQQCYNIARRINCEIEKICVKKASALEKLADVDDCEVYKNYADLLSANLYKLNRRSESVVLENFYGSGEKVEIRLDSNKTPSQNVQAYYEKFKKLKVERNKLKKFIDSCDEDIKFLESELDLLNIAKNRDDVLNVFLSLADRGFYSHKFVKKSLDRFKF